MIEIELNKVKSLLEQTAIINQKHKDIARITGADYNIFSVLRIHRKEVTLHSRMITDLLNTKGKHAQGDLFLDLFLKMVKEKIEPLINEKIKTEVNNNLMSNSHILDSFTKDSFIEVVDEKYAGIVDKITETGGSIDIFLKTNIGTHLIIENKIDAEDQSQQLIRYSNYAHNSIILYLTKHCGSNPNSKSITSGKNATKQVSLKLNNDFFCISYEKDILNWLEECKNEVSHLPHLRETLSQYINIVKRITNQNTNEMNKELAQLIFDNPKYINDINSLSKALESDDYYKLFDEKYGEKILKVFTILIEENESNLTIQGDSFENIAKYNTSKNNIIINYNKDKYFYPSFKFFTKNGYESFRPCIRAINDDISKKYGHLIKGFTNRHSDNILLIGSKEGLTENEFLEKIKSNTFEDYFTSELKELIAICAEAEKEIENQN